MDTLHYLDTTLFLAINHLPHGFVFDSVARLISGVGSWGLIWLVFVLALFIREETRDHRFFIPFVLAGGISALVSEVILKNIFLRPRPDVEMGAIILTSPGNYSFPSTHATIAWAMAVVLSAHEPRLKWVFYTLAVLISLSRIYLGVHYPFDIFIGLLLGYGLGKICNKFERKN